MLVLPYCLFAVATLASASTAAPQVSIRDGVVIGNTKIGVDTFNGIPYAQPPVGNLRLRPPQALAAPFGTLNATGLPPACPPLTLQVDNVTFGQVPLEVLLPVSAIFATVSGVSEDCLSLNIQRPSSATTTSKLPVVFWIYGGASERGSTQDTDFSYLVNQSIFLQHPVIVVQANYRVAAHGFLGGKELQAEGSTNLGLRDQRLALEWVADNIAAFGGDPEKVTLYGESAGSFSVFDQTAINGGDNTYKRKKLFRAAIMDSGTSMPREPIDSDSAQAVYDQIVDAAGCTSTDDSLACLRALSYDDFLNATNSAPSMFTSDGLHVAFFPRPDPSSSFFPVSPEVALQVSPPQVAKVPVIAGGQMDEGTFFSLVFYNITNTDLLVPELQRLFPTASHATIQGLVDLYTPGDPEFGSPFATGPDNELYPGFKRNAAILGDLVFEFQRRAYTSSVANTVPVWAFLGNYGKLQYLGSYHGSDLVLFHNGAPALPYFDILQYYISFVNYLDPNVIGTKNGGRCLRNWQQSTGESQKVMQFEDDSEGLVSVNSRKTAYEYFRNSWSEWRS